MKDSRTRSKHSFRGFFEEQIRFLDFKQTWWQRRKAHRRQKAQIDLSLEHLVNSTNKRIKIVDNYKKKLRKSVASIEVYLEDITNQVIKNMTANVAQYDTEPFLQALFFEEKLCHQFFSVFKIPLSEQGTFHIVSALPVFKEVFMPAVQGDSVIQDARKTVLNFKQKHVEQSTGTQEQLKEALHQFFLEKMLRQIKQEIEPHMVTGYDALKEQGKNYNPLSPKDYLKAIIKLLKHPESLLWLDSVDVITDRFGIVDTQLRDKTFRQFDYFSCQSKHESSFAICVVKSN